MILIFDTRQLRFFFLWFTFFKIWISFVVRSYWAGYFFFRSCLVRSGTEIWFFAFIGCKWWCIHQDIHVLLQCIIFISFHFTVSTVSLFYFILSYSVAFVSRIAQDATYRFDKKKIYIENVQWQNANSWNVNECHESGLFHSSCCELFLFETFSFSPSLSRILS